MGPAVAASVGRNIRDHELLHTSSSLLSSLFLSPLSRSLQLSPLSHRTVMEGTLSLSPTSGVVWIHRTRECLILPDNPSISSPDLDPIGKLLLRLLLLSPHRDLQLPRPGHLPGRVACRNSRLSSADP